MLSVSNIAWEPIVQIFNLFILVCRNHRRKSQVVIFYYTVLSWNENNRYKQGISNVCPLPIAYTEVLGTGSGRNHTLLAKVGYSGQKEKKSRDICIKWPVKTNNNVQSVFVHHALATIPGHFKYNWWLVNITPRLMWAFYINWTILFKKKKTFTFTVSSVMWYTINTRR